MAAYTRVLGAAVADADATGYLVAGAADQASILAAAPGKIGELMSSAAVASKTGADQSVVTATALQQIWVYGYELHADVAGTVAFQDEDNTVLTGAMPIGANGGVAIASPYPLFKVATGKALELDVVTSTVNGVIQYRKVVP